MSYGMVVGRPPMARIPPALTLVLRVSAILKMEETILFCHMEVKMGLYRMVDLGLSFVGSVPL